MSRSVHTHRVVPETSPEEVGLCSQRLLRAKAFLDQRVADRTIAGAVSLIVRRGKLAYLNCHGWQDAEKSIPMTDDAIFRIYSMTKPIVCAAILMLYEESGLWMQDPVKRFLPEFADLKVASTDAQGNKTLDPLSRDVTIHDLLTHTGGLSYALAREFGRTQHTLAEFIPAFCEVPLDGQPGQTWRYSSSNDVLGRVIEVVSGQPLDVFLQERIFTPLGMVDTGFFVPEDKHHRFATLYTHDADAKIVRREIESRPYLHKPTFLSGGGGLVSTIWDYLRFCLMLLNGGAWDGQRLLSPKTVELMRQDHLPPGHLPIMPYNFGYGYGVSVVRSIAEKQGICSVGEFGWGGAAGTNAWIDPQEQMISMVMYQLVESKVPMIDHRYKVAMTQAIVD